MDRMAEHLKKQVVQIEPDALRALREYDWPGNVRELENVLNRAVIVCDGPVLKAVNLALNVSSLPVDPSDELITPEAYERIYRESSGNYRVGYSRSARRGSHMGGPRVDAAQSHKKTGDIPRGRVKIRALRDISRRWIFFISSY